MKKSFIFTITCLICLIFIHFISISAAYGIAQPLMQKALAELEKAKTSDVGQGKLIHLNLAKGHLEMAAKNKGGSKALAINKINRAVKNIHQKKIAQANNLIKLAIKDVKKGIAYADKNNKESQPSMKNAIPLLIKAKESAVGEGKIAQLNTARIFLLSAANDKGGHKEKAIEKIDLALQKININDTKSAHALLDEAIDHIYKGICHAGY